MMSLMNRVEQFFVIWFDEKLDLHQNEIYENELKNLNESFIMTRTRDECEDLIENETSRKPARSIILIVFEPKPSDNLRFLSDAPDGSVMFIFCSNVLNYLNSNYPEIRGTFSNVVDLFSAVKRVMRQTSDTNSFLTLSTENDHSGVTPMDTQTTKDEQSRIKAIFQIHFRNFFNRTDHEELEAAKNLFRNQYLRFDDGDSARSKESDDFNTESIDDNRRHAILWLVTHPNFFHKLNEMWRNEKFYDLEVYRYIIRLINEQIQKENFLKTSDSSEIRLYRGDFVDDEYIETMKINRNKPIVFKGFWSASFNKNFAKKNFENRKTAGLNNVLFVVKIDGKLSHRSAFAELARFTGKLDDAEVIFSLASLFQIESIELNDEENFYTIVLSLIDDNRQSIDVFVSPSQSKDLVEKCKRSIFYGDLFFSLGLFDLFLHCYFKIDEKLMENDENTLIIYFHNIALCYLNLGETTKAEEYFRKAHNRPNFDGVRSLRDLIGLAKFFCERKLFDIAERFAEQAAASPNDRTSELADLFDQLGSIYVEQSQIDKAEKKFYDAFRIRQEYYRGLAGPHYEIGRNCENLASFYARQKRYHIALGFYRYAVDIYSQTYASEWALLRLRNDISSIERQLII